MKTTPILKPFMSVFYVLVLMLTVRAANQAPGYFHTMLGDYEITAIYDGYTPGEATVYIGQPPEKTEEVWAKTFGDTFTKDGKVFIKAPSNLFLVKIKNELILIDAGSGTSLEPTLGRPEKNIGLAGFNTRDVNKILITHPHPGHVNGLTVDGRRFFDVFSG